MKILLHDRMKELKQDWTYRKTRINTLERRMKIPVEELDVGIILDEHEVTPVGQLGCEGWLSLAAMHKPIPKGRVQRA